jgi:signal transduction histidine kinase
MSESIKTVLIIDDEAAIRHSFADYLEDRNFKVLTAENGRTGLELIERSQPHIVLVDLRMPELDGLEVLKRSREFVPDMPKIVISGANRINDVVRALRYGAWDYLVKPVKDLLILEHTVQKALEKAQLLQENRTYQEHLEELVQERTRDLEQAFEALKISEKQLRQSQKMEAIGTLAGGIAHDFNNILSGILGYSQLIEMDIENSEKVKKYIVQVIKGSQRAAGLVQQILTFSRQKDQRKNFLKLCLIVKEAVKFLRSSIPVSIEIQEKMSSQATILADPTQMHQVVMNLCTNAYHAMRDSGGTLTVALTDVELSPRELLLEKSCLPGKYVKLEVKDTGHGMDKKTLGKIFDPYFTTKRSDKGTGLGLAVVNGIVKSHNGFIRSHSEVGFGSTFQVFWPAIEEEASRDISDRQQTGLLQGKEQIMLVDDEIDILNTLQPILEKQGYKITTFKDGMSAFQAFSKDPGFFDLIVTDMTMPQMTGAEFSVEVLKIRTDMPIILCTGYHESFTADIAREIGISKYVNKPVEVQYLSTLIREVMDKKNY